MVQQLSPEKSQHGIVTLVTASYVLQAYRPMSGIQFFVTADLKTENLSAFLVRMRKRRPSPAVSVYSYLPISCFLFFVALFAHTSLSYHPGFPLAGTLSSICAPCASPPCLAALAHWLARQSARRAFSRCDPVMRECKGARTGAYEAVWEGGGTYFTLRADDGSDMCFFYRLCSVMFCCGLCARVKREVHRLYCDYVMKNPFYEMDMPIKVEKWETHLKKLIDRYNGTARMITT